MSKKTDPKPVSQALGNVLQRLGLNKALSRHSIALRWPKLVDSVIANHTKIDKISGDTIFVIVDSAVWMSELSAVRLKLLDKVNRELGKGVAPFKEIRFIQRSWARTRPEPEVKEQEIAPPDEKHLRSVRQILNPLKDEELKRIIDRIVEKDRRLKASRDSSGKSRKRTGA